jgi:hypothetical protein
MSENKPAIDVETELEALRRRSAELIAEVGKINEQIDELAARVKQGPRHATGSVVTDPAAPDPALTDTWVEAKRPDDSRPAT